MSVSFTRASTDPFDQIAYGLDETMDLARPALLLAADEHPNLDIDRYLGHLDDLADAALCTTITDARNDCDAAQRLARFLAEPCGFRGNTLDYYDPSNSLLSEVLERRLGIQITLSLVLMEVGRRLSLPLVGIGFPGHFLVGCSQNCAREMLLIDQFEGGRVVTLEECRKRLTSLGTQFDPDIHLQPISNRQFLLRMLSNLEAAYIQRRDVPRAMRTIRRQVALDPGRTADYLQLGQLLVRDRNFSQARLCLRAYLEACPESERAESVREELSKLLNQRARRN
ncbi:MAG TPA: transglutaminase-like domain-containing protein [Capsulimonadaceae bacterium]|nr:transglutaminase-like domain-containing protein [Capsulimonadaceae bacterium]